MQNQNMFNSIVLQYREIKYILCTLVASQISQIKLVWYIMLPI